MDGTNKHTICSHLVESITKNLHDVQNYRGGDFPWSLTSDEVRQEEINDLVTALEASGADVIDGSECPIDHTQSGSPPEA